MEDGVMERIGPWDVGLLNMQTGKSEELASDCYMAGHRVTDPGSSGIMFL